MPLYADKFSRVEKRTQNPQKPRLLNPGGNFTIINIFINILCFDVIYFKGLWIYCAILVIFNKFPHFGVVSENGK